LPNAHGWVRNERAPQHENAPGYKAQPKFSQSPDSVDLIECLDLFWDLPEHVTGAIIAFTRGAISRAIARGARMSVPLGATPCGFQCAEREQDSSDFCRHPITKFQPIDALHLACAGLGALHFLHAKGYGCAWKA